LVRSRSVSSLMHLTWMMSLVFLSLLKTEEEEEEKDSFPYRRIFSLLHIPVTGGIN
jgi:hypothetical protein